MRTALISILILTNAVIGVALWRSQQQVHGLAREANVFASLFHQVSKQHIEFQRQKFVID
jgi:hypothetical protein